MTENTAAIARQLFITATPEAIFRFLVEPAHVERWLGVALALEPRPGGVFRVEIAPGDTVRGTYRLIEPPRRIAVTWGWEVGPHAALAPGASLLELELEPQVRGAVLRLRHSRLPAAMVAFHEALWTEHLARLEAAAER
jgi:uncharacterized protein YndB with AHSA1/START domain